MPNDREVTYDGRKRAGFMFLKRTFGSIKTTAADSRTISFVASHEKLDADSEVILVDGIDLSRYEANPILLEQHDPRRSAVAEVRNLRRTVIEGAKALVAEAYFPDRPRSDDVLADVRSNLLNGISIGFQSLEQGPPALPGQTGRTHVRTKLLEISLVSLPACETCLVMKSACRCDRDVDLSKLVRPGKLSPKTEIDLDAIEVSPSEAQRLHARTVEHITNLLADELVKFIVEETRREIQRHIDYQMGRVRV